MCMDRIEGIQTVCTVSVCVCVCIYMQDERLGENDRLEGKEGKEENESGKVESWKEYWGGRSSI